MDPLSNPQSILGSTIYGSDGEKLGKAGQVFLDDASGQPEWVTVNTGLFGTKETFVPLQGITARGDDFTVPYDKEKVKGAPSVDSGDGHISESEEDALYRYYGLSGTSGYDTTTTTTTTGTTGTVGTAGTTTGTDAAGTVGHDTSGPTTDDAMTRSEERLHVGTERVQTGRARLRKYIVSENVTETVPVERETVHVEREPITDANRGAAYSGPELSEEEHEVTLTEERPVVAKETVPVERVRLDKDVEVSQETVSDTVRHEEIDVTDAEGVRSDRR
ncbi:DUF2382 domain-containing protein [Vallicoccus soli]|uniref:DUF2382 domain-containing protein n=1 Tax=Vallicoccus soli TaxID=2339232 RepID=A0A3A3ZMQ5_9ACTN|nr:PRC and DUF2382 domain-containing protein [Vallicoccus soli]RJK97971.1 DUF2382 domain-containing protein [Vallicoccus soli]